MFIFLRSQLGHLALNITVHQTRKIQASGHDHSMHTCTNKRFHSYTCLAKVGVLFIDHFLIISKECTPPATEA